MFQVRHHNLLQCITETNHHSFVSLTYSYCWALVHSNPTGSDREAAYRDIDLGLNLIQALLSQMPDSLDGGRRRELLYIQAVGEYRKGEYLNARSILRAVLESYPDFRQAESLLEYVENELVKEGLIGLGAGAAIIGVLGAVTVAALSSGKKR
jgi:fission 1 protein